jgi:hypothetical protein
VKLSPEDWLERLAERVDRMRRELALLREEPEEDIRLQLEDFEKKLGDLVREIDEGVDRLHTHRKPEQDEKTKRG